MPSHLLLRSLPVLALLSVSACAIDPGDAPADQSDDVSEAEGAIRGDVDILRTGQSMNCTTTADSRGVSYVGSAHLLKGGDLNVNWNGCYSLEHRTPQASQFVSASPILFEYWYSKDGARHGIKKLDYSDPVLAGQYKVTPTPVSKSGCAAYGPTCDHVRHAYAFKYTFKGSAGEARSCTTVMRAFSPIPATIRNLSAVGKDVSCK